MNRRSLWFGLLLLVIGAASRATAEVPVLPAPQYVKESAKSFLFQTQLSLEGKGLPQSALQRLQQHWVKFWPASQQPKAGTQTKYAVQLLLLNDQDPASVTSITELAPGWKEKIGQQGYILVINNQHRVLAAYTETGLFYGLQTLRQLTRAQWTTEVLIADWPSFEHRTIYDDISRGPISTVPYIKQQIERLAELKINYLSFYIEHVVQTVAHPDFAPANGKLTITDIKELSAYAAKFHMQLIGSFQSFGHFEKILALPQYKSMGATSTLISPEDANAKKFLENVISEMCDAFSAPFFNVNCDETFDLGKGKSKPIVDSIGAAAFYANHVRFLYDIVKKKNKQLMVWGDIAIQHEAILDMLPKDIIYLTWEYGNPASFDPWIQPFKKRGLEYMVCPGILNSVRMFPDLAMATANINGFTKAGKENGASGVYTTIWDDGGASFFSADWYGVYKAAEKSWQVSATDVGFNAHYTLNAYGVSDTLYVQAALQLMQLRKLPLTFNMNDNFWYQKLVPDSGRRLMLNNADVEEALRIVQKAGASIRKARALRNGEDLRTLAFSIDQYRLTLDARKAIPQIAQRYAETRSLAGSNPTRAIGLLEQSSKELLTLENRYRALSKRFQQIWLTENQAYWLPVPVKLFAEKAGDFQTVNSHLKQAIKNIRTKKTLPEASAIRLNITATNYFYFQNWLLTGPFALQTGNKAPDFLYAPGSPDKQAPKPGDIIEYLGKSYRWQKYASPNGGITELDDFYQTSTGMLAYAFCTLTADSATRINAFIGSNSGIELFCNGQQLISELNTTRQLATEQKITLPLKAGVNFILFKIPKRSADWTFTFRLDPSVTVTNHKHKFYLNPKTGNHEAE